MTRADRLLIFQQCKAALRHYDKQLDGPHSQLAQPPDWTTRQVRALVSEVQYLLHEYNCGRHARG